MVWLLAVLPSLGGNKTKERVEGEVSRGPSASAAEIPMLARLMEKAGWDPAPEMSGVFKPGYVFEATSRGHILQFEDCFSSAAIRSPYAQAEVVTELQGGARIELGVGSIGAGGSLVKVVRFGTPEQLSMPELKMTPTRTCVEVLVEAARRGRDLGQMYVVQEVLLAQITEQRCGSVNASGQFVTLGSADAGLTMACSQESLEPVAIGFRTKPVRELPEIADALAALAPVPTVSPLPASTWSDTPAGYLPIAEEPVRAPPSQRVEVDCAEVCRPYSMRCGVFAAEECLATCGEAETERGRLGECAQYAPCPSTSRAGDRAWERWERITGCDPGDFQSEAVILIKTTP